jgi:hypothetical protein
MQFADQFEGKESPSKNLIHNIFHNVYGAILVITNNTNMFWTSKTWIFVLVEQFYYLVCDAA